MGQTLHQFDESECDRDTQNLLILGIRPSFGLLMFIVTLHLKGARVFSDYLPIIKFTF